MQDITKSYSVFILLEVENKIKRQNEVFFEIKKNKIKLTWNLSKYILRSIINLMDLIKEIHEIESRRKELNLNLILNYLHLCRF